MKVRCPLLRLWIMIESNGRFYLLISFVPNFFEYLKFILPPPPDYLIKELLRQKALTVFAINKSAKKK